MKNQCKYCGKLLLVAQIPIGMKTLFMMSEVCFVCQLSEVGKLETQSQNKEKSE